ncbi:exosome protein [Metallosphaera tengchongensis]|uniref:Exosome protein n=1 Tax=Metallosphaera tengchongensis TaxID=1532350 RepID=A0A6N0NVM6_9CREN|nr:RNA-binding domain-containing protein [Metallosphaera tengchongensis]QKQ99902.1 exosome protein [Metallosphaera tengchongensis]
MRINKISASVFCYSTEDEARVRDALLLLFNNVIQDNEILRIKVEGHYGDPIITLKADLEGKRATDATSYLLSKLDTADIVYLLSTITSRSQGNRIYIRVDKQALISQRKVLLKDGEDVIKIVLSLKDNIKEFMEVLKQLASGNMSV